MKPGRRARLESQLSAYLDGELAPVERQAVEELLQADAGARTLLEELRATAGLLRDLPRATAGPGLAEGVRNRLERKALLGDAATPGPVPESPLLRPGRGLAAAAVIALTCTTGYLIWSFREPPGGRLASQARDAGTHQASADRHDADSPLALARERSVGTLGVDTVAPEPDREQSSTQTPPDQSAAALPPDNAAVPEAGNETALAVAPPVETAGMPAEPPAGAMREQAMVVELAYADGSSRNLARQLLGDRPAARDAQPVTAAETAEEDEVLVDVADAAGAIAVLAELGRTRPLTMKLMIPSDAEQPAPAASFAKAAAPPPAAGDDPHRDDGSTGPGFLELARIQGYLERLKRVLENAPLPRDRSVSTTGGRAPQASLPPESAPEPAFAQAGESPQEARDDHDLKAGAVPAAKAMPASMAPQPSLLEEVPMMTAAWPSTGPAAPTPGVAVPGEAVGLRVRIRWMTPEHTPATAPVAR